MDLQYLKQNVSIIRMAEALGYQYNRQKGRQPKQYEHPNGDKVIINEKLNPNMQVYFARGNYSDQGTAIDFVKHRLSMFNVVYHSEWEGVLKVLKDFVGQPDLKSRDQYQSFPTTNKERQSFKQEDFHIRPAVLNELSYLQYDRKLSKDTLHTFLPYIHTVRRKDQQFSNIGFPYQVPYSKNQGLETEVVGYEMVNYGFRGHARGSQRRQAVWMANLAPAPQLVRDVYIAESAIDAMSFYQLYRHKFDFDHAIFISTGGNVLKHQVKNVLEAFPSAKIHTLFDNDFSGKMYDIYMAGIKSNRDVEIQKKENSVLFKTPKGVFEIPNDQISLSRFEQLTGIRSGVRAHKANAKDFNEMLQKRLEDVAPKRGFKRL